MALSANFALYGGISDRLMSLAVEKIKRQIKNRCSGCTLSEDRLSQPIKEKPILLLLLFDLIAIG